MSTGPGTAQLFISSNDSQRKHVFQIAWFGKATPRLVPSSVELSPRVGETAARDVEISYPGGESAGHLTFVGASALPDGVTVELESEDPCALRAIPGMGASPRQAPSLVVGKAVLRVNGLALRKSPTTATSNIVVRQRGVTYNLPFTITVKPHQGLHARPRGLLFTASSPDRLQRLKRQCIVSSDSARPGRLEVVRKPSFLSVDLEPSVDSDRQTVLTASVTEAPPPGLKESEVLLRNADGDEVAIQVHASCN